MMNSDVIVCSLSCLPFFIVSPLARYCLEDIARLKAASRVNYKKLSCEDQAMIVCQIENGAIANLLCSFVTSDLMNNRWTVLSKALGTKGGTSSSWNEAQFKDDGSPAWGMPCL